MVIQVQICTCMAIQTLKFRAKRESMLERKELENLAGKIDSLCEEVKSIVWKFNNFSTTLILREIKFCQLYLKPS